MLDIEGESIMLQPYPVFDESNIDSEAEAHIDWLKGVVLAIRNIRGEMNISPAKAMPVLMRNGSDLDKERLKDYRHYLRKLAKLDSIDWLEPNQEVPVAATQLHNDLEILVPLADLIDIEAEQVRLEKEIAKLESSLKVVSGNKKFVENAPAEIVSKEREKEQRMAGALRALQQKLNQLASV